jgi:antitoxin ParD1/3/4
MNRCLMGKLSISMPETMQAYVDEAVKLGDYEDISAYVQDLVRRDQDNANKLIALRAAVQAGIDSGISNRTVDEIWAKVEADYQDKHV